MVLTRADTLLRTAKGRDNPRTTFRPMPLITFPKSAAPRVAPTRTPSLILLPKLRASLIMLTGVSLMQLAVAKRLEALTTLGARVRSGMSLDDERTSALDVGTATGALKVRTPESVMSVAKSVLER